MIERNPFYRTEVELSAAFASYLGQCISNQDFVVLKECDLGYCRPDYISLSPRREVGSLSAEATNSVAGGKDWIVEAFELKLTDWRQALSQAKSYLSFADASYVVMPDDTIVKADLLAKSLKGTDVGLIGVSPQGIKIYKIPVLRSRWTWARDRVLSELTVERYSLSNSPRL